MNDVKWIKITTDMFDNRKIKHIRKLPDGNSIVLVWVMLLTLAGRCNAGGMIMLTEKIPYTEKMLADELGFEETTITLALKAFEEFDMVSRENGCVYVLGWEEHQNTDGLEKIREQGRIRQAKFKERQKRLASGITESAGGNVTDNVTVTLPVTLGNATEKEIDIDRLYYINNIADDMRTRVKAQIKYDVVRAFYGEELADMAVKCIAYMHNMDESRKINDVEYSVESVRERAANIFMEDVAAALESFSKARDRIAKEDEYLFVTLFNKPTERKYARLREV